jgi:nitroimidazol reductase NimA-like FMN-containing flavoprotein (pyridoxamine 5'-phosphate oxidase superfamily)
MAVDQGADTGTATREAHRVLAANAYMTLATADADGRPWATPVWFAARGLDAFHWVSRPGSRHSRNIAVRAAVGIVVFDSTVAVGGASAVYVEAQAREVGPDERAAGLAVFNGRAREQGIGLWTEEDVVAPAPFRLYRATASRVHVLDERDGRIAVR